MVLQASKEYTVIILTFIAVLILDSLAAGNLFFCSCTEIHIGKPFMVIKQSCTNLKIFYNYLYSVLNYRGHQLYQR